ncbi:hypothetical protein D0894_25815 [Pseudomonas monteilii]|uniref:Uncharacterized protein n=1 Tax=Pseudomonas monteilii TaxID=76759 RepID=A0A399LYB8_9PSED|nr:hypothetical protein D0894_25815 [Pseudomonas monteilii]
MPEGAATGPVASCVPGGGAGSGRFALLDRCGLLRGQARSHRYCTGSEVCGDPVGAGLPANRPSQPLQNLPISLSLAFAQTPQNLRTAFLAWPSSLR